MSQIERAACQGRPNLNCNTDEISKPSEKQQQETALAAPSGKSLLTRKQRRRMDVLAERVDKITQADARFFERRPDRQHRVRRASPAEIEQAEIVGGPVWVPPECAVFTVVRNIAPGVRLRVFMRAPADSDTDVSEEVVRTIYEAAATEKTREIEAGMRKAMEARA
jgi:hypothetical protein